MARRRVAPEVAGRPDARTEVHAPITAGDAVPAELLDVVLAVVRDRPVEPVARITTQRESQFLYGADGAALAEFCNDHVTAWSAGPADGSDAGPAEQQWREWELELIDATGAAGHELLNRLSNRLLDAGAAPPGTAPSWPRAGPDVTVGARAGAGGSGPPGGGPACGRAADVGSCGARRRRRLRAPDAGDHPQDSQPVARGPGFVRIGRRRVGSRRTA
ncbi:adenylate cyclase domain protein [Mycobacterium kansasii 732]|nr:adenylate cyclase domain protein [Mycobacterium kansasii 732]